MKKLSIYAAMLLATAMTWSCANIDNLDDADNLEPVYQFANGEITYNMHKVGTFAAEPGAEVTLTLGVYDYWDIYAVDFGDGKIVVDSVCYQNLGMIDEATGLSKVGTSYKSATKFSGTVGSDGTIIVYGNSDLWYLNCQGGVMPISNDSRMQKLVQITLSGVDVDEVIIEKADSLKTFAFNNSPVQVVDMSGAPRLTSLKVDNTTSSKYESQLTTVNVSNNPELNYLSLQGNQNARGKLKTLDLTNNPKLAGKGLYVQYNELTEVKMVENDLTTINLSFNNLTEFDLTKMPKLKALYLTDNQLTKLDFSKFVEGGDIQIQNNQLTELIIPVSVKNLYAQNNQIAKYDVADCTNRCQIDHNKLNLATLPICPAGLNTLIKKTRYIYYPQAPYEVPASVKELDLTSQLTAQGMQAEPVTTTFSFATASGTPLVENVDYQQTAPGKFIFIKQQSEKIHAIMATDAFAFFEGANAFVTTDFTAELSDAIEQNNDNGTIFSWEAGVATGGTVVGNGADSGKVTDETITVSSKKANIENDNITITLDKALAAGDIISITGYRKKDTDANGTLYFLFETGAILDEGTDEVKWNNIHENVGQQPNTNTYEVTAEMAGSKKITIARSKASTNVFITKFEITRK